MPTRYCRIELLKCSLGVSTWLGASQRGGLAHHHRQCYLRLLYFFVNWLLFEVVMLPLQKTDVCGRGPRPRNPFAQRLGHWLVHLDGPNISQVEKFGSSTRTNVTCGDPILLHILLRLSNCLSGVCRFFREWAH